MQDVAHGEQLRNDCAAQTPTQWNGYAEKLPQRGAQSALIPSL
jgi:hypothetical protein